MNEAKQRETIEAIFSEIVKRLKSESSPLLYKKIRKAVTKDYKYIELNQYECIFRLYFNKAASSIGYSVRVNLINDRKGKTW